MTGTAEAPEDLVIDLDVPHSALTRLKQFLKLNRDPDKRIVRVLKPVPVHLPDYLTLVVPDQPWAVQFILAVPASELVDLMHAAVSLRVLVPAFLCGVHVAHSIRQLGTVRARQALALPASACTVAAGEALRQSHVVLCETGPYASSMWVNEDGMPVL
jgi:hypothetical protein